MAEEISKKRKKIRERAAKAAARAHKKGEKKGGEVVGTKRVTTAAEPRMLSSKRETVNIYKKEQEALQKGVMKESKQIDKEYEKEQKEKQKRSRKAVSGLKRGRSAGKGLGLKNVLNGRGSSGRKSQTVDKMRMKGRKRASKKAGCFGRNCE